MANYHVVKNQSGGWDAKKEGSQRVSGHFNTQKEAEQTAKAFSSNSGGGEVRIHSLNGKIRDSDTVPPVKSTYEVEALSVIPLARIASELSVLFPSAS